jgi:uncharacterized membrane protein
MDLKGQRQAQQRADRIAAFQAELADLEREQALVLTPEQRAQLERHLKRMLTDLSRQYGVDVGEPSKRISWGMRLASLLGGLALFAAVVLFLHRIWGALPFFAQVGLLVFLPLLALAGTAFGYRRQMPPYYLGLLALASGAAFIMGLNAQGSIFNAVPSPHVLAVWGAFGVLVAYAYGQGLLLGAGLVLLCAYVAALLVSMGGGYWAAFLEQMECLIPPAAALYATPELLRRRQAPEFDLVYRFCGAGLGLLALLVYSKSGDLCCSASTARAVEFLWQVVGLVLSAGVVVHGLRLSSSSLVTLGAIAFSVFLLVRLHAWCWEWMPKYLFFLLISLTALGLLLAFRRLRRTMSERGS